MKLSAVIGQLDGHIIYIVATVRLQFETVSKYFMTNELVQREVATLQESRESCYRKKVSFHFIFSFNIH